MKNAIKLNTKYELQNRQTLQLIKQLAKNSFAETGCYKNKLRTNNPSLT